MEEESEMEARMDDGKVAKVVEMIKDFFSSLAKGDIIVWREFENDAYMFIYGGSFYLDGDRRRISIPGSKYAFTHNGHNGKAFDIQDATSMRIFVNGNVRLSKM